MGLFDSLKALAVGVSTTVKQQGLIGGVTSLFKEGQAAATQTQKTALKVGVAAGVAAGGLALATTATGAAIVSAAGAAAQKVGAAFMAAPLKTKAVVAVTTPIAYGIVSTKPVETATNLIKAPGRLADLGADSTKLFSDFSLANAGQFLSEHKIAVGATAIAGAVAAAPLISSWVNTAAVRGNTKTTIEDIKKSNQILEGAQQLAEGAGSGPQQPIVIVNQLPTTTPTEAGSAATEAVEGVSATTKAAKKKAKPKKKKKKKAVKKKKKSIKTKKTVKKKRKK